MRHWDDDRFEREETPIHYYIHDGTADGRSLLIIYEKSLSHHDNKD